MICLKDWSDYYHNIIDSLNSIKIWFFGCHEFASSKAQNKFLYIFRKISVIK